MGMTAMKLIEHLLAHESVTRTRPHQAHTYRQAAHAIVEMLLRQQRGAKAPLSEASVHRHGSRIWQAVYTGPSGGQVWKSTGTTDYSQAMSLAKEWEAEARAQRDKMGRIR